MKTFEVSFNWNGKYYKEFVTTMDSFKARQLIQGRYPGARILGAREVK